MNIRPATKEDLKQCEEIFNLPELYTAFGQPLTARQLEKYLSDKYFLVAEEAGRIIGGIFGEPLKEGVAIWILVIAENKRGAGVGSDLLDHFENNAKNDGKKWTLLYAPFASKQIIAFYKKHGYAIGQNYTECAKHL